MAARYRMEINASESSYSVSENTSYVTVTIVMYNVDSANAYDNYSSHAQNLNITCVGRTTETQSVSITSYDFRGKSSLTFATVGFTVEHNDEGKMTASISANWTPHSSMWSYMEDYWTGSSTFSASASLPLTDIPRNKTVTISTNGSGGTSKYVLYGKTYSVSGNTISFSDEQSVTVSKPSDTDSRHYNSTASWSSTSGTITGDTTITATFGYTPYYYVNLTKGTGISSVTPSSKTYYATGTTVSISATVLTGYAWSSWSDGNTTQTNRSITLSNDVNLTAQSYHTHPTIEFDTKNACHRVESSGATVQDTQGGYVYIKATVTAGTADISSVTIASNSGKTATSSTQSGTTYSWWFAQDLDDDETYTITATDTIDAGNTNSVVISTATVPLSLYDDSAGSVGLGVGYFASSNHINIGKNMTVTAYNSSGVSASKTAYDIVNLNNVSQLTNDSGYISGSNYNYSAEIEGSNTMGNLLGTLSGKPGMTGSFNCSDHGWMNFIFSPHRTGINTGGDNHLYGSAIAMPMTGSGNSYIIRRSNASSGYSEIKTIIDSGNISSQSVNYASSASNSDTVDSFHICYSDFIVTTDSNGNFSTGLSIWNHELIAIRQIRYNSSYRTSWTSFSWGTWSGSDWECGVNCKNASGGNVSSESIYCTIWWIQW